MNNKLIKIKFIKQTELKNIGDIVDTSLKSAKNAVEEGYAEYIEEPKSKKKTVKKSKKKVAKKEKPQPDYSGLDKFIYILKGSKGAGRLKGINEAHETFHVPKSEIKALLKELESEKKEEKVEAIEVEEEITLSLDEINAELMLNLHKDALETDEFLDELSKKSGKNKSVLKTRLDEIRKINNEPSTELENGDILRREKLLCEFDKYTEKSLNFLEDKYWDSWEKIKKHTKNVWKVNPDKKKWFFLSHAKNTIKGKPQLIEAVQKKIPLVRLVEKKIDMGRGRTEYEDDYFFFDDKFDKRYDGKEKDCFAIDFWLYRVVDDNGKEYYVLCQEQLPQETCTFHGMIVEMDDFAEISKSMKLKSLSRIFVMESYEPSVKILTKDELIEFTKGNKIKEEDWLNFLAYHKLGTYNRFPKEVELLRSSFILSGKAEGWPMHLAVMGPAGTRKTMGHIETISHKFDDDPSIIEGGDSRIKALSPSFKEKPANIGYLAKSERMGWIDEIGKMVEFERNKHQSVIGNVLGELNFLLEHKKRTVGSGNDNECQVQANAKFMFVTNPVSNKWTISDHVGVIDSTTMSRVLWWIQDEEEQNFVLSSEGIQKTPLHYHKTKTILSSSLSKVWGENECRDMFKSIYDTCYSFLTELDDKKIEQLFVDTINIPVEPMKTTVWRPRARHHIKVLVDGLVKHRCLFTDYDNTFTPKDEDYEIAKTILTRMFKSWATNLKYKVSEDDYNGY